MSNKKLIKDMTEDEVIRTVSKAMHQEIRPYLRLAESIVEKFRDIEQGLKSVFLPGASSVKRARLLDSVQKLTDDCQKFIDKEK